MHVRAPILHKLGSQYTCSYYLDTTQYKDRMWIIYGDVRVRGLVEGTLNEGATEQCCTSITVCRCLPIMRRLILLTRLAGVKF